MCALFHHKDDLVVSASLDQTVRVWDIGALRKKTVSPADDFLQLSQMNTDFFGGVDAIVKYVLEGHDRGVNWASFHPTLPLIVSGADDRQLKVWRMNEDKSIRVWDATKRTGLQTFCREHDRFWILTAHPELNLLAAGHDSGMIVFKLQRECPAFSVSGDSVYYVKDRFLRFYEYSSQKDTQVIPIRRPGSNSLNQSPRTLSYSPTENAVLICLDGDGGYYELHIVPKDSFGRVDTVQEAKKGPGGSAIFMARNRFAVLEKSSNQILVKNLKNEIVKKSSLPVVADEIFYAGMLFGQVTWKSVALLSKHSISIADKKLVICLDGDGGYYELHIVPKDSFGRVDTVQEAKRGPGGSAIFVARNRTEDKVVIFDLQQRIVLEDLQTSTIRYVIWSSDMESVALLSKHSISIADKKLVHRCTLHETIRVKSGAWDDNGVFIYTTLTHIKYCLPNGDSGIIRTLDVPVYITKIFGNTIFCLDRDGKNRPIIIDSTEYMFKLSLLRKRFDQVMNMIRSSELCGQAMIAYLQQKGFPEVALHFVKDERTRFNLALESGYIQIAVASAKEIDEKDHWYRLGVEALRQGNSGIVEYAYQRTKNFERLSFFI
ncbi:unnamed protein product [Ilex paraguariensis]|uniref:Coatomer alpha subunit n=1 Tax=Ilex paraguariensis TaxID=185542 RepID=A0ABC8RTC3_9AQUA